MTKLSFAFLFLFFTLSLARTPFTLPENDVTHLKLRSENDVILPELPKTQPVSDITLPELPKNLPGNDVTQLNIPLENDFISHEFPKSLPESDDSTNTVNLPSKFDHEETRSVHPVLLKLVRFRPINRRFRLRSNLPFLLCHHHLKPRPRRQIPFGNDMILSSQRKIDFDKFVYRIGVEQISSDPFNFHQHNYKKISKFPNDREKFGEMKKDQSPHHHHDNDDDEDNDHQQRKISKFLEDREKFGEMKLKDQLHHHHHHYDDNEDNDHEQRKISKFLEDHEKFWGMNLKDQSPYHHHHHHDEKAKEKKKGGFMRGIRKFLHHYFD